VNDILSTINLRATPQTEASTPGQVPNSAGGFTFALDDWARVRRFLTLGSDGGTYYASAKDVTKDNAEVILRAANADGERLVREIVEISTAGRAPRQNPALFALAAASAVGAPAGRAAALEALPLVARTGTHMFLFARYVEQFRGWGRGLRRAVASWYTTPPVGDVAYQAVKYRQREGWSHRDLLRLAHPVTADPERRGLFDWIARPGTDAPVPEIVEAWRALQADELPVVDAVLYIGLTEAPVSWEMLPDRLLAEPTVWRALLERGMPQTALMRQLPRLTRLGVLEGETGRKVAAQLADPERLRRARVHPINVLVAQRTYASGHSARGDGEWTPDQRIVDALDAAFYAAFGAVEPTGKRLLLALDVSGSMTSSISGMPLTAREASAALALVTAATEKDSHVVGFTSGGAGRGWYDRRNTALAPLPISPRQRLDDVIRTVSNLPFGATDCALPMVHAMERGWAVDTFVVYTDNETWHGDVHPHQALRMYRERTGIEAKLVVVGMTATEFSIADPADPGMFDVAGFDSAVPSLVADFARGL